MKLLFIFILLMLVSCSSSEERKPFMIVNKPSEFGVSMVPVAELGVGSGNLSEEELTYNALEQFHYGGLLTFSIRNPVKRFNVFFGKERNEYSKYNDDQRNPQEIYTLSEDVTYVGLSTGVNLGNWKRGGYGIGIEFLPIVKSEFKLFPVNGVSIANYKLDATRYGIAFGFGVPHLGFSVGYRVTDYDADFRNKYFYVNMFLIPFGINLF